MSLADTLDTVTSFVTDNPEVAQVVPRVKGELVGSFEVRVSAGAHDLTVDEPATIGGGDAGPSPVEMALASLASCQAITYQLWATKLGITLDTVRVAVEADYDARGLLGVTGYRRPGVDAVRVMVTVAGPDTERFDELRAVVDKHCPVLDLFSAGVTVTTSLQV